MPESLFTFVELVQRLEPALDHSRWKVVRHKDNRADVPDLFQLSFTDAGREVLDFYQAFQGADLFSACEGIFSFVGLPRSRALFLGAYLVNDTQHVLLPEPASVPAPLRAVWEQWYGEGGNRNYRYELVRDPRFQSLERRVVIDWGGSAVSWHQWKLAKPVVELRDPASHGPCPDYPDIELSLAMLEHLMTNSDANASWKHRLSSVGGIYLLTDHANDMLYVGKTESAEGFWGRWQAYMKRGSGNVAVDDAFASGKLRQDTTTLCILEVVPRGPAQARRINRLESRWKERLRSRVPGRGYNRN